MSPEETVSVQVPASSANLGPGFDTLAVAVDRLMTVSTMPRRPQRVVAEGQGAEDLPDGDDNLIWRALVAYCHWADVTVPDVSLRAHSAIPLERGLGSSAAAAVAGVSLGRLLAVQTDQQQVVAAGSDHDLITLAADFDGHADNAAAAMLGGVVVCTAERSVRVEPSPRLRPVLCVPDRRQATTAARALLPESVPHADAAANGARAALVLAGLSGAVAWQPEAMTDVLHEPPRFRAMPDTGELVQRLRARGVAACLSGAGPSVLAVVGAGTDEEVAAVRSEAGAGWQVQPVSWDRAGAVARPVG